MSALWRYLLAALGVAALLAAVLTVVYFTAPKAPGGGPELARTRTTDNGLFVASLEPEKGVVNQGELHAWVLTVKTKAGEPVEGAAIEVGGGMPQHNHGLPTSPQATGYLGDGRYRIDGIKFSMSGWWQLKFVISAAAGTDSVTFNIVL